jgi:glycerol kinase
MDALCSHVEDTGGVYFVTAFSGLLAPYWDPNAGGMIVGLTQYSTASHIARATLEAVCYQSRAVLDVIEKESGVRLEELKVDGELDVVSPESYHNADIGELQAV